MPLEAHRPGNWWGRFSR